MKNNRVYAEALLTLAYFLTVGFCLDWLLPTNTSTGVFASVVCFCIYVYDRFLANPLDTAGRTS